MVTEGDELALVAGLRADDPEALATLFDRYADRIYNHCFRATGDWTEAEDATATVFLEVWRHRRRVQAHDGSALPWLYGVATNVCRNLTRSGRRRRRALAALPPRPSSPTTPSGSRSGWARRHGCRPCSRRSVSCPRASRRCSA